MRRAFMLGIALLLVVEAALMIPVLSLTSVGGRVLAALAAPPTPTPILSLHAQGAPPAIQAQAAYLIDADTGQVLLDVHGSERLPVASTTKIMTAILTVETANLDQVVTIRQNAIDEVKNYNGSSAGLVVGDQIRLRDLLYGLMLPLRLLTRLAARSASLWRG